MFNFREWENKDVVMHCKTEKEAKAFCKEMHDAGLLWDNGKDYVKENCWENFKKNTVYYFNEGLLGRLRYVPGKYKILKYSDYMDKEKEEVKDEEINEKS